MNANVFKCHLIPTHEGQNIRRELMVRITELPHRTMLISLHLDRRKEKSVAAYAATAIQDAGGLS
jgi:hypothetical protein